MPTLAVVPPMSNEITSGAPMSCPTRPAAVTPAAPPDSSVRTGRRAAKRRRHHPAARVHDLERATDAELGELRFQPGEVAGHDGSDIRAHHGGHRALVLAHLGPDLGRRHHERVGERGTQRARNRALVLGIRVGVEQADGHGRRVATRRRGRATSAASSADSARSTLPSAFTRSGTSNVSCGSTGGVGVVKKRSYRSSSTRASRPRRRRSANPSVTTNASGLPFCSRITLVARVVPCTTLDTSPGATPAPLSTWRTPSMTPTRGSSGVVGTLSTWKLAVGVGEHDVGERAADVDADEPARVAHSSLIRRTRTGSRAPRARA